VELDGKSFIDLGEHGRFERNEPFSFGAWIYPLPGADGAFVARMDDTKSSQGYNLYYQNGLIHFQLIHHAPDNMLTMVSPASLAVNQWHHVFATYDGSAKAAGAKVYVNGKPFAMTVTADTLSKTIVAKVPLRIGSRFPRRGSRGGSMMCGFTTAF
jgi:hypothetical protein